MKDYKVRYRSVGGALTGKEPGDTVQLNELDATRLQELGVVELAKAAPAKAEAPKTKAAAK
ncbi:hypothetical protein [Deinococcus navajonensis]|uniref:Mu-like prophage FluMu N-terminal domain-containing protein n=1 Tax=Deinococcus navajonensis TaxID=309884 RepID=A0ABV8XPR6_9DEIO